MKKGLGKGQNDAGKEDTAWFLHIASLAATAFGRWSPPTPRPKTASLAGPKRNKKMNLLFSKKDAQPQGIGHI
jgi:hypothetical protein